MMNGFFAMLHRAKHIKRWGLMRNSESENLSEHSFDTAVIAHALAEIGNKYMGKSLPSDKIAAAALFHDAHEIMTGDLPTPVKYKDEEIKKAYKKIEEAATESLLGSLPEELRGGYACLLGFSEREPELYRYIKAADKISAFIKCVEECRTGNSEFEIAKELLRAQIESIGLPEADFFMERFAETYGLSLDELQGTAQNRG